MRQLKKCARWSWWPGGGWAWAGSSRRRGFTSLWWAHILHKCLRALVDDLKFCILLRFRALGDVMIIALIPRNEAQNSSSLKRSEAKCCNCKAIKTWCCAVTVSNKKCSGNEKKSYSQPERFLWRHHPRKMWTRSVGKCKAIISRQCAPGCLAWTALGHCWKWKWSAPRLSTKINNI